MDFETFFRSLFSLLKNGDLYYVLYASGCCLLTQIVKKLCVNKVKVDVLHKFDFAVVLPFIFGAAFAAIDLVLVRKIPFGWNFATNFVMTCATVGALSTVIFKLFSSLSGQSLKSLLKDDVFGVFYTQLLYFGNVREQLVNKKLSLKDFISQVKLLSANAVTIYRDETPVEVKKEKLHRLLQGVIDAESISACVENLNRALQAVSEQQNKK